MQIIRYRAFSEESLKHARQNMENASDKIVLTKKTAEDILNDIKNGHVCLDAPGGIENYISDLEKRVKSK
jgi:septum formation inhibitor-activating ATPase MinD